MDDANSVREAMQPWPGAPAAAGKSYRVKAFKSGNSMALRLPAELGIEAGSEMVLRVEDGGYSLVPVVAPKRRIDVSAFWGKAPWLTVPPREDFDDRPRAWDHPDWPHKPDAK